MSAVPLSWDGWMCSVISPSPSTTASTAFASRSSLADSLFPSSLLPAPCFLSFHAAFRHGLPVLLDVLGHFPVFDILCLDGEQPLIARDPQLLPHLRRQLTVARGHRFDARVER